MKFQIHTTVIGTIIPNRYTLKLHAPNSISVPLPPKPMNRRKHLQILKSATLLELRIVNSGITRSKPMRGMRRESRRRRIWLRTSSDYQSRENSLEVISCGRNRFLLCLYTSVVFKLFYLSGFRKGHVYSK